MNCIIVDDEPLALDLMERYVVKVPFLNLVAKCSTVSDVLSVLNSSEIDLMFLDVQMPQLNGIELSELLRDRVMIIFVTAYDKYALDGFKVNAVDYLLKPVSYEDFSKSVSRAYKLYEMKKKVNKASAILERDSDCKKIDNYIFVKSEYKVIQINLNDVLYIEGLKDYVKIHLEGNEKPVVSIMSIKSLEDLLPSNMFFRVHRSFIVQISKVKVIDRSRIVFGNEYIPISYKYKNDFFNFINGHLIK